MQRNCDDNSRNIEALSPYSVKLGMPPAGNRDNGQSYSKWPALSLTKAFN